MTAEQLAERLEARRTGAGQWVTRCPAHNDRAPSLGIREGRKGRTLICCHAGCTVTAILRATGLGLRDLLKVRHHRPKRSGQLIVNAIGLRLCGRREKRMTGRISDSCAH